MADLVLELLRAMRAEMSSMRLDVSEIKLRLNDVHLAVAGLRRDQALDAEVTAHIQARMDRMDERLDMVGRRLDLGDA